MEKQNIPLVRLGDVATWLRPGDRFRHGGREHVVKTVLRDEVRSVVDDLEWTTLPETPVELISPRLEPVPVGGVIPEGTPWNVLSEDHGWCGGFSTNRHTPRTHRCYRFTRDEPDQLPGEVIAGPDTLRVGDRVEFVAAHPGCTKTLEQLNADGPVSIVGRSGDCWKTDSPQRWAVYDAAVVRLLSRANQDPPAAEAQAEAGPQLEPDFTRVIRVGGSGEVEFINIASTNVTVAPKPAAPEKLQAAVEVCGWCREPFWAGRIIANKRNRFCADCEAFRVYPQDSWESNHPLRPAPDPHAHLTPAQRYHLDDDPDASGIPGHN